MRSLALFGRPESQGIAMVLCYLLHPVSSRLRYHLPALHIAFNFRHLSDTLYPLSLPLLSYRLEHNHSLRPHNLYFVDEIPLPRRQTLNEALQILRRLERKDILREQNISQSEVHLLADH